MKPINPIPSAYESYWDSFDWNLYAQIIKNKYQQPQPHTPTMKKQAIKINVQNQCFEPIEIESLQDYYNAIGNGCTTFAVPVTFQNRDSIYCDYEGLFHDNIGAFIMPNFRYPIVGNAVIVGTNEEGDSVDAKSTIEWLSKNVVFIKKTDISLIEYFNSFS